MKANESYTASPAVSIIIFVTPTRLYNKHSAPLLFPRIPDWSVAFSLTIPDKAFVVESNTAGRIESGEGYTSH